MVALALEGFSNSEYCDYDRTGWVEYSKILYKPISIPGIHVFSAWKSTTHNVAHSASRSAPTAQHDLWVAYFSFFVPSLFCICFFPFCQPTRQPWDWLLHRMLAIAHFDPCMQRAYAEESEL